MKPGKALSRSTPLPRGSKPGKSPSFRAKTCRVCQAEFQPRSGVQRYCSPACKRESQRKTYTCAGCGEEYVRFHAGLARGKYCSPSCHAKASSARRRTAPVEDWKPILCAACRKEFVPRRGGNTRKYCSRACARVARRVTWRLKTKGEEGCRNCGRFASHLHHIVPRSKSRDGRDDVKGNGLPLCFDCHRGWHDRVVVIPHGRLADEEFLAAVKRTDLIWVSKNYPDDPVTELYTLYEVRTGTQLYGDDQEPIHVRWNRLTGDRYLPEGAA